MEYSLKHNQTGEQTTFEVAAAARCVICCLWKDASIQTNDSETSAYIDGIRDDLDESDPIATPDIVAFIDVLATILHTLVPHSVRERHKADVLEVMDDLAVVLSGFDRSLLTYSRQRSLRSACIHFACIGLVQTHLVDSMISLVHGWDHDFNIADWRSMP